MKVYAGKEPFYVFNKLLGKLSLKGKQVLIKPNLVTDIPASKGVTTDLGLVKQLISYLKTKGAGVIVGELPMGNASLVFKKLGFNNLSCRVVNFKEDEWVKVKSKTGLVLKELSLPKSVVESDLIISFAKLKTHALTTVTLSIKNLFGLLNSGDRRKAHIKGINESIIDLLSCVKDKTVGLIDGVVCLDGITGPINGKPRKIGLVIGSKDLLSCDCSCTELIGGNPKRVKHLKLSSQHGLGELDYKIIGIKLSDYKQSFNLPPSSIILIGEKLLNRYRKKKPYLISDKCIKCKSCLNNCPSGAISNDISFDYDKCIGCMVCLESCKHGAINYKLNLLARMTHPFYKFLKKMFEKLK